MYLYKYLFLGYWYYEYHSVLLSIAICMYGCRNGILTFSELKNFPVLMHRLGRIHSLFTLPHPLIKTTDYKSQLTEKNCPSSSPGELFTLEMFHKVFLNYCIEQKFFSLMTHYLDLYKYAVMFQVFTFVYIMYAIFLLLLLLYN